MKSICIIVSIVIFNSIMSLERYNLTNGTEMTVNSLKSGDIYDFYIDVPFYKIANVKLEINDMKPTPFSSILAYEYSTTSNLRNETISVDFLKNNNELESSFYYQPFNLATAYIAFRIQPTKDIDYIKIKIDVDDSDFDIISGVSQNFTNLKQNVWYHFLIKVIGGQTCAINLTLNFAHPEYCPKILVFTSQQKNRNNPGLYIQYFDYSIDEKNPRVLYRTDISGYEVEYLDFAICEPLSEINYVLVQMELEYDISLNRGKINVEQNFNYDYPYNYFIKTTMYEKNTINLTLDHISDEPFKYFYIQEYSKIIEGYSNSSNPIFTKTIVDNKLILSCTYIVSDYNTEYIAFKFKFNDLEIKRIEVIDIIGGGAFYWGQVGNVRIKYLEPEYSYYFFIDSNIYKSFKFYMNYSSENNNSLSSVNIQEYSDMNYFNLLREEEKSITSTTENNKFITSFRYIVKEENIDTKYAAIEIFPIFPLYNFTTEFETFNHKYELTEELYQYFYNVVSEGNYYIYIKMNKNKRKINVIIETYNDDENPFSKITLFELKDNEIINSYEKKEELDLKKIKDPCQIFSFSFSHKTSSKNINEVAILIKSKTQMKSMSARFYYSTLSSWIIILIVGISLIVIIAIIIIIICFIKKRRGTKGLSTEIESTVTQPLY